MNKKIASAPHIDRDLSWMYFNRRILQEAMKPNACRRQPLQMYAHRAIRVKFLRRSFLNYTEKHCNKL